ncbi:putative multidrug efflux system protein [Triangularia verruculosa]|uniref:Multidrug efflux system protein n=1 Tax=Triangularia verruculosa TaxID=2587418 RepID=A0AAN6XK64_9PEZI|nr:putative multidrug efflux system protein [Triangularia verruculosa]
MEKRSLSHRRLPSNPEVDKFPGTTEVSSSCDGPSNPSHEFAALTNAEPQYVEGFKLVTLLASVTVVVFLMMLDTSILATAIPRITDEFSSLSDVGWYTSIYQLASAALQPLTGKIYQKFKTQWTFVAFFAIFEIGSAICGASVASWMLITGRAIAGIGGAGLINGALTILGTSVPMSRRPTYTGIMMGFSQLGIIAGPLVGGAFTSYVSWRWCFYVNLPIGAFVFVALSLVHIPDAFQKPRAIDVLRRIYIELDLLGFALLAPAAVQLMLALSWGGNLYPWSSATIIGLFSGAGATTIVFLVWDWYLGDTALIPLSLVTKRAVWTSALTNCCLLFIVYVAGFFLPIYFQAVHGVTPIMSGVYVMASIISQLVLAVMVGPLVQKTGYVIPYAVSAGVIGAISNGLYSTFSPTTPPVQYILYQILGGIGRGAGMQMPLLAVQAILAPQDIAMGTCILVFFQNLGVSILLAAANALFGETLQSELSLAVPYSKAILEAGATKFRGVVQEEHLPAVLEAWSKSIDNVFYMAAAAGGVAVFTALGMGWVDIRKNGGRKKTERDAEDN